MIVYKSERFKKYENKKKHKDYSRDELIDEIFKLQQIIDSLELWLKKNLATEEQQDLQLVLNELNRLKEK